MPFYTKVTLIFSILLQRIIRGIHWNERGKSGTFYAVTCWLTVIVRVRVVWSLKRFRQPEQKSMVFTSSEIVDLTVYSLLLISLVLSTQERTLPHGANNFLSAFDRKRVGNQMMRVDPDPHQIFTHQTMKR